MPKDLKAQYLTFNVFFLALACLFYGCASMPEAPRSEVWVAIRSDDKAGSGIKGDPFNGRGANALNRIFEMLAKKYGENLTINFAPGTYFGQKQVTKIKNGWEIRGSGMDQTIFKTYPDPTSVKTFGFRCTKINNCGFYDLTFDFNLDQMRKANRVFVWHRMGEPFVRYYYSDKLKEWEKGKSYFDTKTKRGFQNSCRYKGVEYIAVKNTRKDLPPSQDKHWTPIHSINCENYPSWNPNTTYKVNTPAKYDGKGYICLTPNRNSKPCAKNRNWGLIDEKRFDPQLYTHAIFSAGTPPQGNLRVERVRGTNTNGCSLFDRENFVIGLGGDNCLIKDCVVDNTRGDYSTEMVIFNGANSRITDCKVYGNGQGYAYGGWGIYDGVFQNNYSKKVMSAVNIDSASNQNVIFKNNEFRDCLKVGILVNMGGQRAKSYGNYKMLYKGHMADLGILTMKNLLIENNLVEMRAGAPYGAAQLQSRGLLSGIVRNNRFIKTEGKESARGVGIFQGANVLIENNILDPGMYISIEQAKDITTKNNRYPDGTPALLHHPKTPKARIDINSDFELLPGEVSHGGSVRHPTWGENRQNGIWARSHDTLKLWTPFEFTFIPTRDGEVTIALMGQYWTDPDSGKKPVPGWVCFDDLRITGATLRNPSFEVIKDKKAVFWGGSGKVVKNQPGASSGVNYIQVWMKAPLSQRIKVKKDRPVKVQMMVKQGGKNGAN